MLQRDMSTAAGVDCRRRLERWPSPSLRKSAWLSFFAGETSSSRRWQTIAPGLNADSGRASNRRARLGPRQLFTGDDSGLLYRDEPGSRGLERLVNGCAQVTGRAGALSRRSKGNWVLVVLEFPIYCVLHYGDAVSPETAGDRVFQVWNGFAFGELKYHSPTMDGPHLREGRNRGKYGSSVVRRTASQRSRASC
jgi:hypothetical protein